MDRYYKHLAISGLISFGGLALILLLQTIPLISNIMTAIFFAGSVAPHCGQASAEVST